MTWLARIAGSAASVAGDGSSWSDWGPASTADHLRDASYGATEPLTDVQLLRYTAQILREVPPAHPLYWRRDGKLLALAGWLAAEQEKKE